MDTKQLANVYFADFECYVDEVIKIVNGKNVSSMQHIAYQIGFESFLKNDYVCFNYDERFPDLASEMLNHICRVSNVEYYFIGDKKIAKNPILIYFHNAKYDTCFFNFNKMSNVNFTIKDGTFYEMSFDFYLKKISYPIIIRDSYKHISYPLKNFCKLFKLPKDFQNKEIMPYQLLHFNIQILLKK